MEQECHGHLLAISPAPELTCTVPLLSRTLPLFSPRFMDEETEEVQLNALGLRVRKRRARI